MMGFKNVSSVLGRDKKRCFLSIATEHTYKYVSNETQKNNVF